MKKIATTGLGLFALWLFAITLSGCGSNANNWLISIEDGQTQIMEISEQLMNGEITNEEATERMEKITANMETQEDMMKDLYKNVSSFDGLPKWAKNLGIYELKNFDLIDSESSVTEYDKYYGMGDSIVLVYTYDDEGEAIQAAEKLAASMKIKETSHSPRLLQKSLDETMNMSEEDRVEYENNKMSWYIADEMKGDYSLMVAVLDGKISIFATNVAQSGN